MELNGVGEEDRYSVSGRKMELVVGHGPCFLYSVRRSVPDRPAWRIGGPHHGTPWPPPPNDAASGKAQLDTVAAAPRSAAEEGLTPMRGRWAFLGNASGNGGGEKECTGRARGPLPAAALARRGATARGREGSWESHQPILSILLFFSIACTHTHTLSLSLSLSLYLSLFLYTAGSINSVLPIDPSSAIILSVVW
jgi:hypothetical protein